MKPIILIVTCIVCILSCSKDGNSNASNGNSSVGTGGSLARFVIVNNYLYVVNSGSINVFDITNNGAPAAKDVVYTGWGIETIFSYNNNLFLGSSDGMFIYSLADPAKPALLGQAQHFRSCDPVVANDSFAFVTLKGGSRCGPVTDGLYTYNVLDLTNPVLISSLEMSTPSGLALNGKILYVCREAEGMSVVNVANAISPSIKKTIPDADFKDVIVYNNLLICYVSTGIRLYDVTIPDNPVYISSVANE